MSTFTRIDHGVERPAPFDISVNGQTVSCHPGETLATALLAAGVGVFRRTASNAPRMPVCNMGVCFDCVVTVSGHGIVRACMTPVARGMEVQLTGVAP